MWPQATRVVCYSLFGMLMLGVTRASGAAAAGPSPELRTEIPIKHLVVIFQENASFDSYFATYPIAANPRGLITRPPPFKARRGTPSINGLNNSLLNFNPNLVNPFRIARLDCFTCDQNHDYQAELEARNQGLMNKYVEFGARPAKEAGEFCKEVEIDGAMTPVTDMGYFDGNTVTALWNYAQFFALNDNAFATMNGESTRGHINLVQADAYGALCAPANGKTGKVWVDGGATVPFCDGPVASVMTAAPTNGALGTLVGDADPDWGHLLGGEGHGGHDGSQHRRPVERPGRHLGLVSGRFQAPGADGRRLHGQPAPEGGLRRGDRRRSRSGPRAAGRLRSTPQSFPVLRSRPRTRCTCARAPPR